MSVTESILKTIDYGIEQKTKTMLNNDVATIITGIGSNGTYKVTINKEDYYVPNGSGITFKVGDLVWLHYPNGDFNKKYISATRSNNSKSYTNSGTGDYGKGGTITPDDFATEADIAAMFD